MNEKQLYPNRIFFNNADSFKGRILCLYLSTQKYVHRGQLITNANIALPLEDVTVPQFEELDFEIHGTVSNYQIKEIPGVSSIISLDDFDSVLKCGFIICDVSSFPDQVNEVKNILKAIEDKLDSLAEKPAAKIQNTQHIVLISTVLTWALTKGSNSNEDNKVFTEDKFKKRKPHPNYKNHLDIEKEIMRLGKKYKEHLRTIVIGAGLTYGNGEDSFLFYFQKVWGGEKIIYIFGNGRNTLPVIHIGDLSLIVGAIIQNFPVETEYILAVEEKCPRYQEIVFSIGQSFGSGKFKFVSKEEAFLDQDMSQEIYDSFTLNLEMKPTFITENLTLMWSYSFSLLDDLRHVFNEYKGFRQLRSYKILILGPPSVGKSRLAQRMSEYYGFPYISQNNLLHNIIDELNWKIDFYNKTQQKELTDEEVTPSTHNINEYFSSDQATVEDLDTFKEELKSLSELQELPVNLLARYLKRIFTSNDSLNRGWVLEGFPETLPQCFEVFSEQGFINVEDNNFEEEYAFNNVNTMMLPDNVILLEASDTFLYERVMILPEKDVANTPYREELTVKRIREYRENNDNENSPIIFFDDLDINILRIDVTEDNSPDMNLIFELLIKKVGKKCDQYFKEEYGSEVVEIKPDFEEAKRCITEENEEKVKCWTELYKLLREEEEQMLLLHSDSLRQYLVKDIFPLLTRGLVQVAELRPQDPIDFLAEYLFRENSNGNSFDPAYNPSVEHLVNACEEYKKFEPKDTDVNISSGPDANTM